MRWEFSANATSLEVLDGLACAGHALGSIAKINQVPIVMETESETARRASAVLSISLSIFLQKIFSSNSTITHTNKVD